jgi:hypothetical protein
MSVFISNFDNPDAWTVTHDDAPGGSHEASVAHTGIKHATGIDGAPNHQSAVVACPVCGSVSTHPVGGGAQPPLVQEMFVRLVQRDDCPCPDNFKAARSFSAAKEHVKVHTEEMDGVGRWQVPETVTA